MADVWQRRWTDLLRRYRYSKKHCVGGNAAFQNALQESWAQLKAHHDAYVGKAKDKPNLPKQPQPAAEGSVGLGPASLAYSRTAGAKAEVVQALQQPASASFKSGSYY